MKTAKILPIAAVLWIATVVGAYLTGKNQTPEAKTPVNVVSTTVSPSQNVQNATEIIRVKASSDPILKTRASTTDASNMNQLIARKRSTASDEQLSASSFNRPISEVIRDSLADSDPISRMARFTEALSGLNPNNTQDVLEQFKSSGNTGGREFSMFLYAWAKIDGPAAMDYNKNNHRRGWADTQNSYSAMSGFAAVDAEGAEQWARENFEGKDNPYLIGVINGVAKTDLQKATDLTYTLPYGRIRGRALDVLIDGYFKQGEQDAMTWASNLESGVLKNGIVSRVTSRLSRTDPNLAADFVTTLESGEERSYASISLADSWSRTDPKAASLWASSIPEDTVRGKALEETVEQWARRDTAEVGQFLESQPDGEYLDGAKKEFAERLRFNDPVEALTWAATLTNEENRHQLMERIAEEWSERDPEAAAAFLNQ